ncbi:MAG: hypothetical protein U9O64_00455 [Campylobacterota bacterium]|nr:hypothetical protein [Campylobacterota bacterium]
MKYTILTLSSLLFFTGCMTQDPTPVQKPIVSEKKETEVKKPKAKRTPPPPAPKKEVELKEVEDTNYNDAYMYPQAPEEKIVQPASVPIASNGSMGKEACVAMISQEKFDKYTAMFGSEAASIKRCDMIKAMNQ